MDMSNRENSSKIRSVIRVASGNFLEMYDFMVYAYYASYIAREIFPTSSEFASLMLTLGTFGAGYLMRPLGAVVLGSYVDRHGRRSGLILTLFLMAIGTARDCLHSGVPHDWHPGSGDRGPRTVAAGIFRRGRTRRRVRISF